MRTLYPNKIHIEHAWGLFVGQFNDNKLHRHFYLQISVSAQGTFTIIDKNMISKSYQTCFINTNVPHQFISEEKTLILLINPIGSIGHLFCQKFSNIPIAQLDKELLEISQIFTHYLQKHQDFVKLTQEIGQFLTNFKCNCELQNHPNDDRIYKAIVYLEKHTERVVSLEEIAQLCHLSKTRFLHLFKEKTNINYRRYQLWNKLNQSLPYLKFQNITQTAHQFGFTDSAHYTRTFKETFGLNPKMMLQNK